MATKPEQASTEMAQVLKSIADMLDGNGESNCQATSELSKWAKYVGCKIAESGGGKNVVYLQCNLTTGDSPTFYFTDITSSYSKLTEDEVSEIMADENNLVVVSDSGGIMMTPIYDYHFTYIYPGDSLDDMRIYYIYKNSRYGTYKLITCNIAAGTTTSQSLTYQLPE